MTTITSCLYSFISILYVYVCQTENSQIVTIWEDERSIIAMTLLSSLRHTRTHTHLEQLTAVVMDDSPS